jgi:hypothetical protein
MIQATKQSNVSIWVGLTIFMLPGGHNEWLSSIIDSLYENSSIQLGLGVLFSSFYVGSSLHDLTTIPENWLSQEFLATHASLYGTNFNRDYYNILSDLYTHYTDLLRVNVELHEAFYNLREFLHSELLQDFLRVYFLSNEFAGGLELSNDFTSNLERFNDLMNQFLNRYEAFGNTVLRVHTVLEQIQTVNPSFNFPLPCFNPIRITPAEWFIIDLYEPNFVWDPVIFQFADFSASLLQDLNHLVEAINNQPLVVVQDVVSSYNQARVTSSTLPFNFFARSNSLNLFEIELQERRSRARTLSDIDDLPPSPFRSRSSSSSDSRSRSSSRDRDSSPT